MDAARITASPFTITGSIGVIGGWVWNEGLGKKLGMTSDRVQIGHSADLLGGLTLPLLGVKIPERNLDEHECVVVKRGLLELYDDFTKRVAEGRGIEVGRVREIAEGRVYAGRAALGFRLVDEIASLDRTIEEAKAAAGIRKGRRVRIEEYPKQKLFPLPGFARWVGARIAGGAGGAGGSTAADDGNGALGEHPGGPVGSSSAWTYEARTLGRMLRSPGLPLLLTPPSLLPDEPAAR
jgi:protease-4